MKNKYKIKILNNDHLSGTNFSIPLDKALQHLCYLRTARKEGDIEVINNTQLGRLKDNKINFQILDENKKQQIQYNNWKIPNNKSIRQEYDIEYKHHIKNQFGNIFKKFDDFEKAVLNGEIKLISKTFNSKIENRSNTKTKEELIDLIKNYKSYPEFRNEKTIDNLYQRFKNNQEIDMPIILKYDNNAYWIISGNTRMDISYQLGIIPKAIIIDKNLNENDNCLLPILKTIVKETIEIRSKEADYTNISNEIEDLFNKKKLVYRDIYKSKINLEPYILIGDRLELVRWNFFDMTFKLFNHNRNEYQTVSFNELKRIIG